MGCKGRRRREKNFDAAHGGNARLPPPPKLKELDALPSKLRKLMEFMNPSSTKQGPQQKPANGGHEKKRGNSAADKEANQKDVHSSSKREEENDLNLDSNSNDSKKRKRKRKAVDDLRFQNLDEAARSSKKERRKEYFELRKKKHKKTNANEVRDFPGREEIKFGEIVDAPPKLSFPKARKTSLDASQERIRLRAIEDYRNRRGWVSRPGIQLPTSAETPSS